jgi:hypothetical protein
VEYGGKMQVDAYEYFERIVVRKDIYSDFVEESKET